MSFRTLLTHVVADGACDARLRMTASAAQALGARLIGLGAEAPWPFASDLDGGGQAFESLVRTARDDLKAAHDAFDRVMAGSGVETAWREEVGYADVALPRHARAADMVVTYRRGMNEDRISYATTETVVMETGLPVLLLPEREVAFKAETIVLAWKNSREARRAITTTLPLLTAAQRVLVVAICDEATRQETERELADVAERLSRHGARASTRVQPDRGGAAALELLGTADSEGADLIVAGGYAHSRMREWVLGGVTRDLIADASRYVLLSH